ncbi:hypothetical protein AA313_de0203376 [Arthrobotrys entomopaga]|nr:hypothetical protein AA313_de0203376 [Arthrobotrys entomopaga]
MECVGLIAEPPKGVKWLCPLCRGEEPDRSSLPKLAITSSNTMKEHNNMIGEIGSTSSREPFKIPFTASPSLCGIGLRDEFSADSDDSPDFHIDFTGLFGSRPLVDIDLDIGDISAAMAMAPASSLHKTSYMEGPAATDSGYASLRCDKKANDETQYNGAQTNERPSTSKNPIAADDFLESDDTQTVYSNASSLATTTKGLYISELADALFQAVCTEEPDIKTLDRVSGALPELLKAFALKVGYNAPSQMHRDVMYFVHKNRGEDTEMARNTQAMDFMTLDEKMDFWLKGLGNNVDSFEDHIMENTEENLEQEDEDEDLELDQSTLAYRDFIFKTPAFEWLVASLRRDVLLETTEPNSMETIRKEIIRSLPSSRRVSKMKSAEAFKVIYMTGWDPFLFLTEQQYKDEDGPEAIMRAITLTGSTDDAQALTCAQYIRQTWPLNGKHIVWLINDVVRGGPRSQHTCM